MAPATGFWSNIALSGHGTSYAAPQVTGTIAQLCGLYPVLKTKQAAMGAILMASAAEKVQTETTGNGEIGDKFDYDEVDDFLNAQISNKQGAGILNGGYARRVAGTANYWTEYINASAFPYNKYVTISASNSTVIRMAIFWLKRNTASGTDHQNITEVPFTNLSLYIYDPNGDAVALSIESWSNFEIVQFAQTVTGSYRIQIKATNSIDRETVGIAVWYN